MITWKPGVFHTWENHLKNCDWYWVLPDTTYQIIWLLGTCAQTAHVCFAKLSLCSRETGLTFILTLAQAVTLSLQLLWTMTPQAVWTKHSTGEYLPDLTFRCLWTSVSHFPLSPLRFCNSNSFRCTVALKGSPKHAAFMIIIRDIRKRS